MNSSVQSFHKIARRLQIQQGSDDSENVQKRWERQKKNDENLYGAWEGKDFGKRRKTVTEMTGETEMQGINDLH